LILRLPDAALYLARLSPRLPARVPLSNRAHLFVTRGAASLGTGSIPGPRLAAGDAARITDESELSLVTGTTSEALIWTLGRLVRPASLARAESRVRRRAPTVRRTSTKGRVMTIDRGILALLEAKPGKGGDLAAFLAQGRELAAAEEGTVTWYAFKLNDTTYGIFDTFEGEDGRQAHLNGADPRGAWPSRT
jgi:hypothetical protein